MGKNKNQGTRWETELKKTFQSKGWLSDRYALKGIKGEPDLFAIRFHEEENYPDKVWALPVVIWRRLVNTGGTRRQPDGAKDVVVMELGRFLTLVSLLDPKVVVRLEVQAKACERLNVTHTLADLQTALDRLDKEIF